MGKAFAWEGIISPLKLLILSLENSKLSFSKSTLLNSNFVSTMVFSVEIASFILFDVDSISFEIDCWIKDKRSCFSWTSSYISWELIGFAPTCPSKYIPGLSEISGIFEVFETLLKLFNKVLISGCLSSKCILLELTATSTVFTISLVISNCVEIEECCFWRFATFTILDEILDKKLLPIDFSILSEGFCSVISFVFRE